MSTPLTIEREFHFDRRGHGGRKEVQPGPEPKRPAERGRVPRVTRFMALAIRFDQLIQTGAICSCSELARLGQVTRARVSQILSLVYLAPDIQEAILFLPRTQTGRDAVILRDVLTIALVSDWRKQRKLWAELTRP